MSGLHINSPNTLLVLDWDGTIAASDTLSLIAPSPEALKPYTKAYMDDMQSLSEIMGSRDSLPKMKTWLDAMEEVEFTSVKRVEDGGLFKGMTRSSMLERARDHSKLDLQAGAVDLLKDFKGRWGIVSVGWSGDFIKAALESRGVDLDTKNIEISANEVEFDVDGKGTGKISKHQSNSQGIRVAKDKQREMKRMVEDWRKARSEQEKEGVVVYVGDSETDLLCLLDADVGIIMNSPGMVEKVKKLGLGIEEGLDNLSGRSPNEQPPLRYVEDFRSLVNA